MGQRRTTLGMAAVLSALAAPAHAAGGKCVGSIGDRLICLVTKVSDLVVHVAWIGLGIAVVVAGALWFFGKKDMYKLWLAIIGGGAVLFLLPFLLENLRELGDPEVRACGAGGHERCVLVSEDPLTVWLIPPGLTDREAFDCYRASGGMLRGYSMCVQGALAKRGDRRVR